MSMKHLLVVALTLILIVNAADPIFRGMNIGGWLVLESWMTPTLFNDNGIKSGVGEWGFTQTLGKAKSETVLKAHWDSWVSQSDLQKLASHGITHLRVPVGYWIVSIQSNEPFVTGGMDYLKRLLGWAHDLNLGVIVDLHGAPGSQNGHDNSGRDGPINWQASANVARTVSVLANLTSQVMGFLPLSVLNALMNLGPLLLVDLLLLMCSKISI